jgi:hypothetical protein
VSRCAFRHRACAHRGWRVGDTSRGRGRRLSRPDRRAHGRTSRRADRFGDDARDRERDPEWGAAITRVAVLEPFRPVLSPAPFVWPAHACPRARPTPATPSI